LFLHIRVLLIYYQQHRIGEGYDHPYLSIAAIFRPFRNELPYLGTFQISDLTYNTLGGAAGGVIYYLGYSRRRKK